MPSLSREEASSTVIDGYRSQEVEWHGYTVAYETIESDTDAVERFQALPGGGCQCPHWGYQIDGESTYVFADREETYRGGDFFYLPPGHAPRHKEGARWVTFSPTEAHHVTRTATKAMS